MLKNKLIHNSYIYKQRQTTKRQREHIHKPKYYASKRHKVPIQIETIDHTNLPDPHSHCKHMATNMG
jgi:hypothetical protein